jgi:D-glycero-D-manno-heptose 1,7-bisphosphate phosphatase
MTVIPGAAQVISLANRRGIPVIEVTNQAGIGSVYYGWKEFIDVEKAPACELACSGAVVDGVFACPYHPDGVGRWALPAHPARKPHPGMLLAAAHLMNPDLGSSWIVGDKLNDFKAGLQRSSMGALQVLTGHGQEHRRAALK